MLELWCWRPYTSNRSVIWRTFRFWLTLFCPIAQLDRNGNFIIITLDENCPQIMRKLILRQIAYWRPFFEVKILCFQISHPHCISQSLRKRHWADEGDRVSQAFSNPTSCIEHSIVGRVRISLASLSGRARMFTRLRVVRGALNWRRRQHCCSSQRAPASP